MHTCGGGLTTAACGIAGCAGLWTGVAAATEAGKSRGLRSREAPALAAAMRALRAAISASVASRMGPCSFAQLLSSLRRFRHTFHRIGIPILLMEPSNAMTSVLYF